MTKTKISTSSLLLGLCVIACSPKKELEPQIEQLQPPTSSLLQAVSMVDERTVWISGHNATFTRSIDAGESWEVFQHPTGDTLQFRDIHAFDSERVLLMSAGPGPLSRMYSFTRPDQWQLTFVMEDSLGFLDCIDFWDDQRGIAYGDAIDNYPYILLTQDGGQSWQRADTTSLPVAGKGEGGFAASGTCVTTGSDGTAWIATGAGGNARFLITQDHGQTWQSVDSPIVKGDAAGNTSVAFVGQTGFATGGDLLQPSAYTDNCTFTFDGGRSWTLGNTPQTKGAFYGGALTKAGDTHFAFACGPNGIDFRQ